MTKLEALVALRNNVRNPVTGINNELTMRAVNYSGLAWGAVMGSINDARELCKDEITFEHQWTLSEGSGGCECYLVVWPNGSSGGEENSYTGHDKRPSVAFFLAILEYMIEMEQNK